MTSPTPAAESSGGDQAAQAASASASASVGSGTSTEDTTADAGAAGAMIAAAATTTASSTASRISLTLPQISVRRRTKKRPAGPPGGGGGGGRKKGKKRSDNALDDEGGGGGGGGGGSDSGSSSADNAEGGMSSEESGDDDGGANTHVVNGNASGAEGGAATAPPAAAAAAAEDGSADSGSSSVTSTAQNKNQAKEIARDTIGVGETQCFSGMSPHEVLVVGDKIVKVSAEPEVHHDHGHGGSGGAAAGGSAAAGGDGSGGEGHGKQQHAQQQQQQQPQPQQRVPAAAGQQLTRQELLQRQYAENVIQYRAQQADMHRRHGEGGVVGATTSSAATAPAAAGGGNVGIGGGSGAISNSSLSHQQRSDVGNASGNGGDPNGPPQQPDGWRVKLYRLNPDGTWDDCGTGRIVCLIHGRHDGPPYKKKRRLSSGGDGSGDSSGSSSGASKATKGSIEPDATGRASPTTTSAESNSSSGSGLASPPPTAEPPTTIEGLYGHLGEPTLLMRAEVLPPGGRSHPHQHHHHHHVHHGGGAGAAAVGVGSPSSDGDGGDGDSRVLLRTRVLLRGDAYQRQGDNIITWCEPCFGDEGSESGASESDAESASDTSDNEAEAVPATAATAGAAGGVAATAGGGGGGRISPAGRGRAASPMSEKVDSKSRNIDGKKSPSLSPEDDSKGSGGGIAANEQDDEPPPGVDLALSFQDNAGCLDIWSKITNVQSRAVEVLHHNTGSRPGARALLDPAVHGDHHRSRHGHGHHHHHHSHGHSHHAHGHGAASLVDGMEAGDHRHNQGAAKQRAGGSSPNLMSDDGEVGSQADVVSKLAAAAAAARAEPGDIVSSDDDSPSSGPLGMHGNATMEHASALASMAAEMTDEVGGVSLPPPTSENLPNITTTLSTVPLPSQRESYAIFLSQNECAYLRNLLSLFAPAEQRGDYPTLATLAACVKTVLLLNDAAIIEPIIESGPLFEDICAALEYDPDLRTKARHRHFLRNCTKFRTVLPMDEREGSPDYETIEAIFRSFRVAYLRDTILRPTMDESSLSTLSSLGSFVNTDVVRGVMVPPIDPSDTGIQGDSSSQSYLGRVLDVLTTEILEVRKMEHEEAKKNGGTLPPTTQQPATHATATSSGPWTQHISPQDTSLASRRIRRSDCLRFLKELFSIVRENLQQSDRDDFFESMCLMEVSLDADSEEGKIGDDTKGIKVLSLLGCILSDPNATILEKSAVLEITSSIAVHDPCLVRRHVLDEQKKDLPPRPSPDDKSAVTFVPHKPDLLLSLLCALAVETDVGLLLQVSEVMRIILDTDMAHTDVVGGEISGFSAASAAGGGDGGYGGLMDMDVGPGGSSQGSDAGDLAPSASHGSGMMGMGLDDSPHSAPQGSVESAIKEENRFLSLFYEFYVAWLVAPFQYSIFVPSVAPLLVLTEKKEESSAKENDIVLSAAPPCAVRSSFAIEILSFCVRAHVYRMKFYVLRSRVLGTILGLLVGGPRSGVNTNAGKFRHSSGSGNRCLELSALRFLRAVLSVRDEFYHRHIVQQDLFKPVFDAFRNNPVGDNLVSSAVIEMCNFIRTENIRSLVEYIATKHLVLGTGNENDLKNGENGSHQRTLSLEDVAAPHVDTLAQLRQKYEENLLTVGARGQGSESDENQPPRSRYFGNGSIDGAAAAAAAAGQVGARVAMSEQAREDQRKFREVEAEEAFFAEGDDDEEMTSASASEGGIATSSSAAPVDMRVAQPSGVTSPPPHM